MNRYQKSLNQKQCSNKHKLTPSMAAFIITILYLSLRPDCVNMILPSHFRLLNIRNMELKPSLQLQPKLLQYESGSLSHRWVPGR